MSERCQVCFDRYLTVWKAPDELWLKVTGHADGSGTWCPRCFDELARAQGIELYWACSEQEYPEGGLDKR